MAPIDTAIIRTHCIRHRGLLTLGALVCLGSLVTIWEVEVSRFTTLSNQDLQIDIAVDLSNKYVCVHCMYWYSIRFSSNFEAHS